MNWLKHLLGRKPTTDPTASATSRDPVAAPGHADAENADAENADAENAGEENAGEEVDDRLHSPVDSYRLIPPRSSQAIGPWAKAFPDYPEIVGYSYLGHCFLRDPESDDYIVLHPFKWAAKSYGSHASVEAFERDVLKEPGFSLFVLRSDHVAAIHRRLGDPAEDEIYIPEPYPFLGGTEAPESYAKGNVWVFMAIVAQMGGIED